MKNFVNIILASICVTLIFLAGKKEDQEKIVQNPTYVEKKITYDAINDYKEALFLAQTKNNKILVVFHAKWCIPCQKFNYEVLQSSRIKNKIKQKDFTEVYVDIDDEKNIELRNKYNIKTIPFYVLIDKTEKIIRKDEGYKNSRDFYNWLD